MPRAIRILAPGELRTRVIDTLLLNFAQRRMQRGVVFGARGTSVEFDFAKPLVLRTDDALALDDDSVVEIVAEAEPLIEVRADVPTLARLAWQLGDRHVAVQFLPNRIRFRADAALGSLLAASGGKVTHINAPFEPEGGAYATAPSGHDRQHHGHDHAHHDHAHGHDHVHHEHDHDAHSHPQKSRT
jgi:urease accessory protein